MAKLTMTDKFKIQNAILEGQSVEQISTSLNKAEDAVQEFANEFNAKLNKNTDNSELEKVKAELEQLKSEQKEESVSEEIELLEEVEIEVLHKLKRQGFKEEDAIFALKNVKQKLTVRIDDVNQLVGICIQSMSIHNAMINNGAGGQEGVSIMTSAASQIAEEKSKYHQNNVPERNCMYQPKTGTVK